VFDRNQGTIRQAQLDYRRQEEKIRRTELMLQQEMANVYQQYLTALQIASEYDRVIIPEAELAYQELLESQPSGLADCLGCSNGLLRFATGARSTTGTGPHQRSARSWLLGTGTRSMAAVDQ